MMNARQARELTTKARDKMFDEIDVHVECVITCIMDDIVRATDHALTSKHFIHVPNSNTPEAIRKEVNELVFERLKALGYRLEFVGNDCFKSFTVVW